MEQLVSLFQSASILLFGYFIPALSSVKSVVHKDVESFHQWCTYWLILHLYTTILSPILHLTLPPLFQLIAMLWLSLPRFQGAAVVYDRIVVPWVNKYEVQVDSSIDVAHKGARRWALEKLKTIIWAVVGEGGSLVELLIQGVVGSSKLFDKRDSPRRIDTRNDIITVVASIPPQHSVKEALRQSSSSIDNMIMNEDQSLDENLIHDFTSMLSNGLYVFANIERIDEFKEQQESAFEGGFKLGIFSFAEGVISIAPAPTGRSQQQEPSIDRFSIKNLTRMAPSAQQSLSFEFSNTTIIRFEIVLSDENDRDILFNGLKQCFPISRNE